jgi:hypothetical protein
MATTYEPIGTTTTAGVSSITFNSLSGYTDLILVCIGYESAGAYAVCRLNGDSGTNYSRTALRGNGSTATSARVSNETAWYVDLAANPNTSILHFMNYANATTYKTMIARWNDHTNVVAAQVNLWRNTAAITSIALTSSGGGATIVGTYTLYGIKAA